MKRVITFGVFDTMHFGHVALFERAKQLGDFLIVACQDDAYVTKNKPNTKLINNVSKRLSDVASCASVDLAISYSQIDLDIKKQDFDILVVGPDQNNEHFVRAKEWCKRNSKTVVVLPRTEGISSTMIRNQLK